MTTGSWNRDAFSVAIDDYIGIKWNRSWSGEDRVKRTRPRYETYVTYRDDTDKYGKVYSKRLVFRVPRAGLTGEATRVVKRAYLEEHAYSMTERRMPSQVFQVKIPPGSPGGSGYNWPNAEPQRSASRYQTSTWLAVPLFTGNDEIKLIGKLKDLLDGSDFNMGIFLGELGESLGLIGQTATNLALSLSLARAGKFQAAANTLVSGTTRKPQKHKDGKPNAKDLAGRWLELQYGWLPLLSDTEAAAKMLAHHLNVPMQKTYRVSRRVESRLKSQVELGPNVGNLAFGTSTRSHRRGIIARIKEKGSIPQMLGLTDPMAVAWELVPYSFVADWFIPIGSWLEARALVNRLTGTFIISDKQEGRRHVPTCKYLITNVSGSAWYSVNFSRSVSTTLKVPMPNFKPLSSVASWQHCANAVALLTGTFAGGGKPR